MADANEFLKTLPADLQADPSLAGIPDLPTLAKNYVETKKLVGMDKVVLPKEANDPLWHAEGGVWSRLGRPKTAGEYKLPKLEGMPEGFAFSEEGTKAFLETAHKIGMPQAHVEGLFSMFAKMQSDAYKKILSEAEAQGANAEVLDINWGGRDYELPPAACPGEISITSKSSELG